MQSFIHSSTTIPKTYSSNTFTGSNTFPSLTLGSLNGPLHANAGVISATTSIGVLYGGTGLTSAPTYGQMLVGNSSGGYTLTATSSLGITGGSSLFTDAGNTTYLTATGDTLGIGTTSPQVKFTVASSTDFVSLGVETAATPRLILGNTTNKWVIDNSAGALRFITSAANDGAAGTVRALIDSGGSVGIGTASPNSPNTSKLNVNWDSSSQQGIQMVTTSGTFNGGAMLFVNNAGGTSGFIGQSQNAVSFNTSSDRRVKENIRTTTLGLDALMRLSVRDFSFRTDATHATTSGFVAQELYEIFPWAVTTNGDNGIDPLTGTSTPWSVDYGRITPLLAKSIQDLNVKLEDLTTTTPELEEGSYTSRFFASLFTRLTQWFADTTNGIGDFFARVGNFGRVNTDELCTKKSDGTEVCASGDQLAEILSASAAAGTPAQGGSGGAPDGPSAAGEPSADDGSITPEDDSNATATTSPAAANDNEPVVAEDSADVPTDEAEAQEATPEPANDNPPPPSAEAI